MNRLWVRLSLAYSSVFLLFVLAFSLAFFLLNRAGVAEPFRPVRELPAESQQTLLERLPRDILRVAFFSGLVGIGAGVLMSRYLTAPLNELEEAAQAIGAQDLGRRVNVYGSQEIVAVGRAFNEMAGALEKAEALRSNLIADVSHELRTPLTVLQGNLRAILDDVYPLDKEEVARLYDQTRYLIRLVNDLHELAQAEAQQLPLNMQEMDLRQLVQNTAATFAPMAEAAGVALRTELPDVTPPIQADAARLTQALHNLLANALHHAAEGGIITISLAQTPGKLELKVQDSGEGISAEHLAHVFDRFYRTDRSRSRDKGGTGLGLAIVQAIVQTHGGRVSAASEGLGRGSTFTIHLPL